MKIVDFSVREADTYKKSKKNFSKDFAILTKTLKNFCCPLKS